MWIPVIKFIKECNFNRIQTILYNGQYNWNWPTSSTLCLPYRISAQYVKCLCDKCKTEFTILCKIKRPLGRPRRRWMDNIRMDLQEVGCGYGDWIGLAQDRDGRRKLVNAVMNLRVP